MQGNMMCDAILLVCVSVPLLIETWEMEMETEGGGWMHAETQKRKRMENKLIKSWKTPQYLVKEALSRRGWTRCIYSTSLRDLPPPTRPTTVPELDPELTLEDILSHELDQVLSSSTQLEYQSMLRLYTSAPKTSSSAMPSTRLSISASSEETEIIHRSRCHDSVEYP